MADNHTNRKILIVDDTPENVDILGEVLSNYKKQVALNGEKALKIASSNNKPDLILLDIMMPEMDGFEVCKRLKENSDTKEIPVIFITAKSEVEDETRGLELGAVDFIPKPISPPVVLARVKNQLELLSAREILQVQNEELTVRNKYITDSINYAKRIQTSILPKKDYIQSILPNHFLIFKPKDIVSGDFYWIHKLDNKLILAQIDCTGHGVPGALMAMIGNTILNEIVVMNKVTDSAQIINLLDQRLLEELNKDSNNDTKDGMDLALCVLDLNDCRLQYSGAFRPLFYIKNNELLELKGDKKSIGDVTKSSKKYTSTVIDIDKDTAVYLFSDGMVDQNNIDNKKFGSREFKNLLIKISDKNFEEQKEIILSAFNEHKGNEEQRDDLTVIGFNLNGALGETKSDKLYYKNSFTHDFVIGVGEEVEKKFSETIPRKSYKSLYFSVMELAQNIGHYSVDTESISGKSEGKGELAINIDGSQIQIISENMISNNAAEKLAKNLDHYNKLDRGELKALLKEKLKSEGDSESKGGGIGFIEIIKRTENPIEYEINKIDENKSQIKLIAKIIIGENDG